MEQLSKTDAQKRADRITGFQQELEQLEKERVLCLEPEHKTAVTAYHKGMLEAFARGFDIDTGRREKQFSLGMRMASFLGALALAASVFFLFYQFWGRFSTSVQVLVLTLAPLSTLVLTGVAAARESSGYFSKIFGLVCVACFVLNLVMLGQIFNIVPSENAFLVWALFAFLLAYATDARLLLAAGIISMACFLSARAGTWSGCYWVYFGTRPENFFPAALLLFVIPLFISHKSFSGFDVTYRVFALLLFFVIFLYTKFFDWWWDWMPKYVFFFVVALTDILALLVFKRLRSSELQTAEVTS